MLARLLAAASLVVAVSAGAMAQGVEVKDAWARATPGGAETAAIYLTLVAPTPNRLTGIATPAAQKAELHSMTMTGDIMRMRPVDGVDLPPGQAVALQPGGLHIMLTGLAKPLQAGDSFPLTLSFAGGMPQEVTVAVRGVGAMGPPGLSVPHGTLPPAMPMPMPR